MGHWAQKFFVCLYIGPVAEAKDESLSEKEVSLSKETVLVDRRS